MDKKKDWALILGIINLLYFLVTWGIGWIPGMTGWIATDNLVALMIGSNLVIYHYLKK